jgi:transcriptional regulator with XRE-family HTH domain
VLEKKRVVKPGWRVNRAIAAEKLKEAGTLTRFGQLRRQAGLTQIDLANKTGKLQPYIQRLEKDPEQIWKTSLRNAKQLADAIGCTHDDFLMDVQ